LNEFDWIETYLKPLAGPEGLGLLDDAALFKPRQGQDLVLTKDTLVEGVHFFKGEYGAGTAERLMVVNLSDLAAKGARPLGYLLSIAWPKHLDEANLKQWMQGFAKGLGAQQDAFGFKLFGGDTVRTSGPMTVSATFIGTVPEGEMVKRSAAHIGDDIWVTGTIGDAHLGLLLAQKSEQITEPDGQAIWTWEEAFRHPKPRLLFRKVLRQYATSCADISDGLLSEAGHISKASGTKLTLDLRSVPLSPSTRQWCKSDNVQDRIIELVTGGDDYELLFTSKSEDRAALVEAASKLNLEITNIGSVSEGEGVTCLDLEGQPVSIANTGYSHF
jgi:thiamine-monophosphate kinase